VIRCGGSSRASLESAAITTSPGAEISGFRRPSRVGPIDENRLYDPSIAPPLQYLAPEASVQHGRVVQDPTVIAPAATAGSPNVVCQSGASNVAPPPDEIQAFQDPSPALSDDRCSFTAQPLEGDAPDTEMYA
jgi:hypothetical protein